MKQFIILICFLAFLCNANAQNTVTTPVYHPEHPDSLLFEIVEEQPEFPGGLNAMMLFIRDNVKYPQEALNKEIAGTAVVKFVVEKDGSLTNIEVVRDPGGGLGAEAERIIREMPKWTPGAQRNQPVRVQMMAPIRFSLTKKSKNKK